jgi:hypothetical protein
MDDKEAFSEAFLSANARPEFIAYEFADVIRNLVRAFAGDDPSRPIYIASQKMDLVNDLLLRCKDHVSWYSLFADAIANIHSHLSKGPIKDGCDSAARAGTKYLVEASADDDAAAARSSRRRQEFLRAAEWALEHPRSH